MENLVTLCDILYATKMDNVAIIIATEPPHEYSRDILRNKISHLSNDLRISGNTSICAYII